MKKIVAMVVMSVGLLASPCVMVAQNAAPAAIPADQQPTNEQLSKLFEVMRIRQQMQGMMSMIESTAKQQVQQQISQMEQQGGQAAMTPEKKEQIQKVMEKYLQKAMGLYPIDEMLTDMGDVYKKHISKTDVDAFIAFYASPAGQHLLDQQPAIMQEYMPLVMNRMQSRMKDLNTELMKDMAEVAKPAPAAQK